MSECGSGFGQRVWCAVAWAVFFLPLLWTGCSRSNADLSPQSKSSAQRAETLTDAETGLLKENVAAAFRAVKFPFYVYQDAGIGAFVPDGWMGDSKDVRINPQHGGSPHSGKTCVKIEYLPGASQNSRWAGVYWQFPGNYWGKRKGGYDLTGAKRLGFWARGELGGEVIQEVKIGGISGTYRDSDSAGIGPITLTKEWQQFVINLEGVDLSYISGGFCWSTNLDLNKNGCTFYLDDIAYE